MVKCFAKPVSGPQNLPLFPVYQAHLVTGGVFAVFVASAAAQGFSGCFQKAALGLGPGEAKVEPGWYRVELYTFLAEFQGDLVTFVLVKVDLAQQAQGVGVILVKTNGALQPAYGLSRPAYSVQRFPKIAEPTV
jgi:hypothetical protein